MINSTLQYRHELKFFMNPQQHRIVSSRLKALATPDPNVGASGEYHIRSLYFDDVNNTALHEKLAGIADRVKYRIRIYNVEDSVIYFEKKVKFRDYIAKQKIRLSREDCEDIVAGRYEFLHNPGSPFKMELYDQFKHHLLRPRVIVDYVREPYICPNGNVRITFDKELRTGLHSVDLFNKQLSPVRAMDENFIILEVKYDAYIPDYLKSALQLEGLTRQSASKYVICRKFLKYNTWEDY